MCPEDRTMPEPPTNPRVASEGNQAELDRWAEHLGGTPHPEVAWMWRMPSSDAAWRLAAALNTDGWSASCSATGLVWLDPASLPETDLFSCWRRCQCCDDWWCTRHGMHTAECICPPIEDWGDVDPYLGPGDPVRGDAPPPA